MLRAIDNLCSVTNYRQSGEFDTVVCCPRHCRHIVGLVAGDVSSRVGSHADTKGSEMAGDALATEDECNRHCSQV